ncbi:MAG: Holliday junction branch migration protein RuvA [Sphaerochaetaceae bacterium]|nr:Holliday junction branch migration protein RuvA [Sphaerochaetaceae bacterium]MDC7236919.1 Holliday junction branch migration protein RuvA [Sphaerochaetaceae bacterium]MDC7243095.1 Holliday junction branch migration protein RuvA [Sphaerochaetaceae bacterium]MDC7248888.1 Holliday junction branch migration protein RuvA [Sphaerochaetaceae bacterium]
MINAIYGEITSISVTNVIIKSNNIEFDLLVASSTAAKLNALTDKSEVRVVTYLQHREDAMTLFGFVDEREREFFLQLQNVSGIGAKGALKIMGGVTFKDFVIMLDNSDVTSLSKLPGIGKKTASKLVLALRGQLVVDDLEKSNSEIPVQSEQFKELIVALVDMGYDRNKATKEIHKLYDLHKDKLEKLSAHDVESYLFRLAISNLS